MAETHSDSGHIIPAPGAEARKCGGSRHFRRTPSAPGFPKEQLKLSSGGGVAIITFSNETFQDASGNPKEPLNQSSAALSGSFAPTFRFENLEIRKGFLQFSNLNLETKSLADRSCD